MSTHCGVSPDSVRYHPTMQRYRPTVNPVLPLSEIKEEYRECIKNEYCDMSWDIVRWLEDFIPNETGCVRCLLFNDYLFNDGYVNAFQFISYTMNWEPLQIFHCLKDTITPRGWAMIAQKYPVLIQEMTFIDTSVFLTGVEPTIDYIKILFAHGANTETLGEYYDRTNPEMVALYMHYNECPDISNAVTAVSIMGIMNNERLAIMAFDTIKPAMFLMRVKCIMRHFPGIHEYNNQLLLRIATAHHAIVLNKIRDHFNKGDHETQNGVCKIARKIAKSHNLYKAVRLLSCYMVRRDLMDTIYAQYTSRNLAPPKCLVNNAGVSCAVSDKDTPEEWFMEQYNKHPSILYQLEYFRVIKSLSKMSDDYEPNNEMSRTKWIHVKEPQQLSCGSI